jgi:hypothetical protein
MTATHVPHLPNEILYEILGYVDDEDLLNLRLSAKVFHAITADRFAVTFFKNRAYDMSTNGLKALVKITEHPSFARHIRTIVIGHGGKLTPTKHNNFLEQAFQNLANIGNTISLGLRQVRKCRKYHIKRAKILSDTTEIFRKKVLGAAIRARVPLGNLIADIQSAPQNRLFPSVSEDWVASCTRRLLNDAVSGGQFRGLEIKFSSTESHFSSSGRILISNRSKRLGVSQVDTGKWYYLLPYGYRTHFKEIVLENCDVNSYCLQMLFEDTGHVLQRLSLHNVRLLASPNGGRPSSWTALFAAPALSLLVLESCKLGNIWDQTNGIWLQGGDKTIEASTRAQVFTVISNLAAGNRTFTLNS